MSSLLVSVALPWARVVLAGDAGVGDLLLLPRGVDPQPGGQVRQAGGGPLVVVVVPVPGLLRPPLGVGLVVVGPTRVV